MSRISIQNFSKTLIVISLFSLLLNGCGSNGSGGTDSDHGLVPAPTTQTPDINGTSDGNNSGDSDTNTSVGDSDDNASTGGSDDNASTGASDDANGTTGGVDDNDSTGGNTVVDTIPPVITLNGEATMTLAQGAVYSEPGATALDAVDGNVSVAIAGTVDTSTVGTYTITYTAKDRAGNEAKATRHIKVVKAIPTLTALTLESNTTTLNKGTTAQLALTGTYSDATTQPITSGITYTITPPSSAEVNGTTLTTLQDGNITIQAKVGNQTSNPLTLSVYWEVNGHRLPPEPDKTLNDATLLGIDVNHNGVRDDVERWIYEKYKDKHPIHIDIAMQAGRAYKLVLEHPEKAKEIHDEVRKAVQCEMYYSLFADLYNEPLLVTESITSKYYRHKIYFNTKERMNAYIQYDTLLSGDSYALPKDKEKKAACDFNTSKYDKE